MKHLLFFAGSAVTALLLSASCANGENGLVSKAVAGCVKTVKTVSNQFVSEGTKDPGEVIEHDFNVNAPFAKISVSNAFEVHFTQSGKGGNGTVKGSIPEKLLAEMEVKVKDGKLSVDTKKNFGDYKLNKRPVLYIQSPSIEKVSLSGACHFTAETALTAGDNDLTFSVSGATGIVLGQVNCKEFNVELSGASSLECSSLNAVECDVEVSGASSVVLSGNVTEANLEASGASNIDASRLEAKGGKAEASGASSIHCDKNLRTDVSGVSSINN